MASVHEACEQCDACAKEPVAFVKTVAGMAYGFPGDMLIQDFKEMGRLDYGPALASLIARSVRARMPQSDWPDLLIPVPASRSALKRRGFNPAGELAAQLSRQLSIPSRPAGLACKFDHAPQKTLDLRQRMAMVRGRYACELLLSSQRIGLVDDVMTTGSTLREISQVLMRQGAGSVMVLVAARTPMAPPDLAKSRYV
jgi:ComF family protein